MMTITSKKAWLLTLIGALFFFYSFFQANMMAALQEPLMQQFQATAQSVGLVSAFYFYASIIFILPAGLILDRFPVRKIMMVNMALIILGTLIFAISNNLFLVGIARFISGIMMAFGLLACLKLASIVLPGEKMAMASAWIITIGMIGGMFSGVLTQSWVAYFGWRWAVMLIALLGLFIWAILWAVVHIPHEHTEEKELKDIRTHESIWYSLWTVMKNGQNWYCGLFTCLVNLPVAIFGALFGIGYLSQLAPISLATAASITSMLFFGMIVGSPFFGWLSNYMHQRRLPMVLGSSACLALVLILLYIPITNVMVLFVLFFAMGFTSAAQVLGYPAISENNSPDLTATALSLASILILGLGYGLGLPFVGWLLDMGAKGAVLEAYHNAFLTIPIGLIIGILFSFLMKEKKHAEKIG